MQLVKLSFYVTTRDGFAGSHPRFRSDSGKYDSDSDSRETESLVPPESSGIVGIVRNRPESSGIDRNRPESTGIAWNRPESPGIARNRWNRPESPRIVGIVRNRPELSGIVRNRSESPGIDRNRRNSRNSISFHVQWRVKRWADWAAARGPGDLGAPSLWMFDFVPGWDFYHLFQIDLFLIN